ncbi:MAG: HD domain-containing protein [archaeon]
MNETKAIQYALHALSGLNPSLEHHDLEHTKSFVLPCVELLCKKEGVSSEETALLRTAAAFHDLGYLEEYHNNEYVAIRIAKEQLPKFEYTTEEIATVERLIRITNLRTNPSKLDECILRDADISHLGSKRFFERSDKYRKELAARGKRYSDKEWLQFQIQFMNQQQYYTTTAKKLLDPIRKQNIEKMQEMLKDLS